MQENRQHPRKAARFPVAIRIEGTSNVATGVTRDLSIGGMFVDTSVAVAFGTKVVVSIDMPAGGGAVLLPAVVRWVAPDGVGLQFGLLGARETHAIAQLLTRKP